MGSALALLAQGELHTADALDSGLLSGTAIAAAPFTVPAGERWVPRLVTVRWVSSAGVGNRLVTARFRDSADAVLAAMVAPAQAASLTIHDYFTAGVFADEVAVVGGSIILRLPQFFVMEAGEDLVVLDTAAVDGALDTARVRLNYQKISVV
jgi:hypothetical protein